MEGREWESEGEGRAFETRRMVREGLVAFARELKAPGWARVEVWGMSSKG